MDDDAINPGIDPAAGDGGGNEEPVITPPADGGDGGDSGAGDQGAGDGGTGGDGGEPVTPEEKAQKANDDEWAAAEEELFPGLKSTTKKDGKENEQAKPGEKPKEAATPPANTQGKNGKPQSGAGDDAGASGKGDGTGGDKPKDGEEDGEESEKVDTARIDARRADRAYQQEVDVVKNEVRTKMFGDVATQLKDADGDPISTLEDVMKHINPNTRTAENPNGRNFNEEEAGQWLLAQQQQLNRNLENVDKQVGQIAETLMDVKDQADTVRFRYGELLKAMPEVRDKVWAAWEKTLVKDAKTGIITKVPIPMDEFYELHLEPYAELGRQAEAEQAKENGGKPAAGGDKTPPAQQTEAEKKAAEAEARNKKRQDRSDIYGPGNTDTRTDDQKEWDAAEETVFGANK